MDDGRLLQRFGREFPRGTVLFREGEPGREMFVVQSGLVTITKRAGGAEQVLSTLGQGEFFGEMSILTSQARTATAVVAEDARLLVIDSGTFESMVRNNAEIAVRLVKKLAERLAAADDLISNLLFHDASSRIVHWLATQAERAARGPGPVKLPFSRTALPALVGVDPAEAEEVVAKLLRAGIAELAPGGMTIPDVAKLRHFLEFLQMKPRGGDEP
jgi:CRP/FNR family transcriptional regulator, cyclic AMP receptor protein